MYEVCEHNESSALVREFEGVVRDTLEMVSLGELTIVQGTAAIMLAYCSIPMHCLSQEEREALIVKQEEALEALEASAHSGVTSRPG